MIRLLWGALFALSFTATEPAWQEAMRDGTQVAPYPPMHHVEWSEVPVGGLILMNPARADSGAIVIPAGSVLEVPHLVEGPDPDAS